MHWTRRNFIEACSAVAGALGIGGIAVASRQLEGRAFFDDWRALPGMTMTLHLDVEQPESTEVTLIAKYDGTETKLGTLPGAQSIDIQVPFIPTKAESYELCAYVEDKLGRRCQADSVEVLSQNYRFGM